MDQSIELDVSTLAANEALIIEGAPGPARRAAVADCCRALEDGADVTVLRCDFDEGGPWAGLRELLQEIFPTLQAQAPDLVIHHDYELALVVPALRRHIHVRNPSLTDMAMGDEAVRNYALDRAFRVVHGIVELLASWRARMRPGRRWLLVCEDLDRGGALVRRAMGELLRRKGAALGLRLVATVAPQGRAQLGDELAARPARVIHVDGPADEAPRRDAIAMRRTAVSLEDMLQRDPSAIEELLPALLSAWQASDQPERARRWLARALGACNHYGMYEDARRYGEQVIDHLDEISDNEMTRWNIVGNLFHALVATGAADRARAFVEREALGKLTEPDLRLKAGYVIAMLHARYLPTKDLDAAERYLTQVIAGVESLDLPDEQKHFLAVFFSNGLAFVRQRQGRPQEAIAICRAGFARLEQHLPPTRHQLHRSVLLFNIAQVLNATRAYDDAVTHLTATIAIDPNYSEYYNERGNALLRLGRFVEALADYDRAITLSPPYAEVRLNRGQCLRQLGRVGEALIAFGEALELDPGNRLARQARAQLHDELGQLGAADQDYSELLRVDGDQPLVLANRAAVRFAAGRILDSMADLDRAIALKPDDAQLHYNRALAYDRAGLAAAAARDLRLCLSLVPDGVERVAIRDRLLQLERGQPAHVG